MRGDNNKLHSKKCKKKVIIISNEHKSYGNLHKLEDFFYKRATVNHSKGIFCRYGEWCDYEYN